MQTEIDQFLTEQNALLSQQNSLLAEQNEVLSQQVKFIKEYFDHLQRSRAEFKGQNQQLELRERSSTSINFGYESRTFKARAGRVFGAITASISRNLRIQLQRQLMTALNQLNLNRTVRDLVKIELQPIQQTIRTQQTDLEAALSIILQLQVPTDFYTDLEMQSKQINTLGETVERLMTLI